MPRRHKPTLIPRKMTLVEWMVVAAIVAILLSIILPALRQAARRARHARYASVAEQMERGVPEGQLNTIEAPATSSTPHRPPGPRAPGPPIGGIVNLIIWAAIIAAAAKAIRRRREMQARAARDRESGPDA